MSKLTRRTLLGSVLAAGLLGACSPGEQSPTPSVSGGQPLVIGLTYVPDIQFAPLYVADKLGYFTDEQVTVTLRHHGAQETLLGALQTGDEDVVFAGGGEMMQGRSQGIGVINFATMYQNYPVAIIVPEDSDIHSLADLKNRRVGLPGEYGENWFFLLACLREADLTREDLTIESIGYTQLAALTGAKVDAVVGYLNNDLERFKESGFPTRTLVLDNPPLVSVGFGALDETVRARSEDLPRFLAAVERAARYCADNPDETVTIAVDYVETLVDEEQKARALATLNATMPLYLGQFGHQDAQRWEAMATFLADEGLLGEPVSASECFTDQISG